MPNFMIAYHGGERPSSKEEGMAHMVKWKEWVSELGDKVVNPGTPLMNTKIITSANAAVENDPNSMKGFAIIKAESSDAAIEIAKSDPFLQTKGTIRVSEMMEM